MNTVPILIPALRERKEDIHLLFRKFASDFATKYRMPVIKLNTEAEELLINYYWPGNVRQLKNVAEQISVIEKNREIIKPTLVKYLPQNTTNQLPVLVKDINQTPEFSERELLYKILFDMRNDIVELKKLVVALLKNGGQMDSEFSNNNAHIIQKLYQEIHTDNSNETSVQINQPREQQIVDETPVSNAEVVEESLSIQEKEIDLIQKALKKHRGKRKNAAKELGISERTLYRKINEYNIQE